MLRNLAYLLARLLVLPVTLVDRLLLLGSDGGFQVCTQFMSLFPGKVGSYLRLAYLQGALPDCARTGVVGFGTIFSQRNTLLGDNIYIGAQCNIGSCRIGDHTLIASGVHIMSGTGQHNFDDLDTPIQQQGGHYEQISIGRDCWIGNGSLVMADIGDQSIVGAGSVVTQPIPAGCVAVGNPARVIRERRAAEDADS